MDTTGSHVLVVDDDLDTCNQLRDYLGSNDFRVTAVNTAKQVVELLTCEAIDVLLLGTRSNSADALQLTRRSGNRRRSPSSCFPHALTRRIG